MKKIAKLLLFFFIAHSAFATGNRTNAPDVNPLDLEFQRLAVRRFIFSNNLNLNELVPSEIVSFKSMHPAFGISDNEDRKCDEKFTSKIVRGKLCLDKTCGDGPTSIYVGGVNPYATYELDVESISYTGLEKVEVGIEFAKKNLRDRVQVIALSSRDKSGIFVRVFKDTNLEQEYCYSDSLPNGTFQLHVQLCGNALGVYIKQYGETKYLGHVTSDKNFGHIIDFRQIDTFRKSTFNLVSNLKGSVLINKASSYLSAGVGQADIRLISYEDLSPYMDEGRLWFTFSCRGLDISQSAQGVLSLDPSLFDVRFEGMIVFDHGDGLLQAGIY